MERILFPLLVLLVFKTSTSLFAQPSRNGNYWAAIKNTSVNEQPDFSKGAQQQWTMTPDAFSSTVYIKETEKSIAPTKMVITDIAGNIAYSTYFNSVGSFNVQDLAKGAYLIHISNGQDNQDLKLNVE